MQKKKPLKFNWDPEKSARNEDKYGVSFDEAATIFTDRHALFHHDLEHSQKEMREIIISRAPARKRLLTCFFTRIEDGAIQIIGARVSTHRERQDYDDNSETKAKTKVIYQIK